MMNKENLFRNIIEENYSRIYKILCYYTKNKNDRDDVFQEVLINIWNNLEKFKGNSQISTWIYRITVNTALGFLKNEKKYTTTFETIQVEQIMNNQAEIETFEEHEKTIAVLLNSINILPIIDKIIISLYIEELSSKEIAEIIGITESNVRTKIHRIKNDLKITSKGE